MQPINEQEHLLENIENELPVLKQKHPFGYVIDGEVYGATEAGLKKAISTFGASRIEYVWMPDSENLTRPEQTKYVFEIYKDGARRSARGNIILGSLFVILPLVLALFAGDWTLTFKSLIGLLGVALLANGLWEFHQSRKLTRENLAKTIEDERNVIKNISAIKTVSTPYQTYVILGCIGVVYLVQMYAATGKPIVYSGEIYDGISKSVFLAGQIKEFVREGEYWRMFTANLMHANFIHIMFNGMALWNIGRTIEQHLHNSYVALVFFISGFCGSVFSQFLSSSQASIGASGGILGMIGFLAVGAYIYKEIFPREYFKSLLQNIGLIVIIGIVGYSVIDNYAHAGGLFCGVGLGFLLLKRKASFPKQPSSVIEVLSLASLAGIVLTALICIFVLVRN